MKPIVTISNEFACYRQNAQIPHDKTPSEFTSPFPKPVSYDDIPNPYQGLSANRGFLWSVSDILNPLLEKSVSLSS